MCPSFCLMSPNSEIGLPNCTRSFACFVERSISTFMPPTVPPPRPLRPEFKMFIATLKPLPTSPSTLPAGIRTLSKCTVVVDDARRPILSS
jgi:hypothetical protein